MARTLNEKLSELHPERQKKIHARAQELISEEATLRELRKALELTQSALGEKLHINQEAISRLENRSDLLLSTLSAYINAMGGELSITVNFPNMREVKLTGLAGLKEGGKHNSA